MSLFPLFLKLEGKRCLVVGGGPVGLEKAESLLRCGARVRLVSPRVIPGIEKLVQAGAIEWLPRPFEPDDLIGVLLAIAATNDRETNRQVFEEAERRSILSNVVDDPPLCGFFCASVIQRGDLQIAISTAGKSPAFAQRLRREIDERLAPGLGSWLDDLGERRREILATMPAGEARKKLLHRLAERELPVAQECPARGLAHETADAHAEKGTVYLVGAGPGDPELLTRKAAALLADADVILHDDLVAASILSLAGDRALVMSVGKRCGRKKITQAAIHDLMISSARRNLAVVRLKAGDSSIFGRAGEEIDALRAAQVPFEIVPGVTAVSSAAALLKTSLTDRRVASKLVILSGHTAADAADESRYSSEIFSEDTTVAIYMPSSDLSHLAATLLRNGASGSLPCVAVGGASRPDACFAACRLEGLASLDLPAGPRLLLVGRAFESIVSGEAGIGAAEELAAFLEQLAEPASSAY